MLFKNEKGKQHDISINIGNARKVSRLYDVDLMDAQHTLDAIKDFDKEKHGKGTMLMADICMTLAKSHDPNLDEDLFYESLAGDSLTDLQEAFLGSLANFCPSQAMRAILRKSIKMIQKTQADLLKKVQETDFSEVLKGGN